MVTTKKKSAAKATPERKVAERPAKKHVLRSFKQASEPTPFLTFQPTRQTVYWLILSALVLGLGMWVMYLDAKVQDIYNQIDMNNSTLNSPIHTPVKKAN